MSKSISLFLAPVFVQSEKEFTVFATAQRYNENFKRVSATNFTKLDFRLRDYRRQRKINHHWGQCADVQYLEDTLVSLYTEDPGRDKCYK